MKIDTSVSRSEEEMEEMEGEDGGGTKSLAGSSIVVLWICGERERGGGRWILEVLGERQRG
jgi:hypothetical protein